MNKFEQIEVCDLSASTQDKRFLLHCKGKYYEANSRVVELVHCLQSFDTQEEAVLSYTEKNQGKYSVEQIEQLTAKYVLPLLVETTENKKTFLYEKELFSAKKINRFSDMFSFLFCKPVMVSIALLVASLNACFILFADNVLRFDNNVTVYTIIGLLFFTLFSSFFHEIGHASACKYFKIFHGGVGFGLYLTFPVLYTDVTEVWKLKRGQRCIVNLAGIYFQSFCLLLLLVTYFLTQNDVVRYMILMMNLGFVITLNPFFKFDGYWIVSDLLGVPNLRKRSKELLGYLYQRIRGKENVGKPYLLQIKKVEKCCLLVYSVLVNFFMGYYFFYIIPRFIIIFIHSFPDELKQLVLYLSNDITPSFSLLRNIIMQIVFLVFIGVFCVSLIRKLLKYAGYK